MKKDKRKLIIYIIGLILVFCFYWFSLPLTMTLNCCWSEPCPEPVLKESFVKIGCLIATFIFIILIVRTIIRMKKSK